MDFLNQALVQIRDLFRTMTPAARITSALLLAVVVISLGYLFNHQVSSADSYLMGGEPFSASQMPAMEAAFAKAKLSDYEVVGNRIRVPRGKNALYMGALADAGALPATFGSSLEKALASSSPFEGKRDQAARMMAAKQNELALILRAMQGIENASVLYDIKEGRGLSRKDTITATVSVKPIGNEPLDPNRVPMIRNLVAGAIAGLRREDVTVADLNGRVFAGGGTEVGTGDPAEDPYYSRKKMFEQGLEHKIAESLVYVPGVVVKVNAELDPEKRHIEESVDYDPKTVPVMQKARSKTNMAKGAAPAGGRPGLAAQAVGPAAGESSVSANQANSSTRASSSESEDAEEETRNVVSTKNIQREMAGLTPKTVKVTVIIPSAYYAQVWNEKNKPAPGDPVKPVDPKALEDIQTETKKNIENAVVALLPPVPAGTDPFPRVMVTTFQSLTQPAIVEPTLAKNALAWLGDYWGTLGMGGLALFSLLTLRSMVRSVPNAEPAPAVAQPALSLAPEEDDSAADDGNTEMRLKRRIRKGPNLKDDLSDMVREDPEAAAAILRGWIGNAA